MLKHVLPRGRMAGARKPGPAGTLARRQRRGSSAWLVAAAEPVCPLCGVILHAAALEQLLIDLAA